MNYLPPFFVHGSHKISDEDLELHGIAYHNIIKKLSQEAHNTEDIQKFDYLNNWIKS